MLKQNLTRGVKIYRGDLQSYDALNKDFRRNRFWTLIATCIDKKDVGKNSALWCGIFAYQIKKLKKLRIIFSQSKNQRA